MIPVLYASTETMFTTNGIGRLADAISCTVTEERNGIYELEMEYPIDGIHFSEIHEDRIIFAKPYDGAMVNQAFRIYKISRPISGVVTVSAEHISYLLNKMVVMPFTASSCREAMSSIAANAASECPFTFTTDKEVNAQFNLEEPKPIRSLLGGEQGSILGVYGTGEYEFNNFDVILRVNRGQNRGVTLRYGKNITDLVRSTDMTNAYTGIVPFWKNDETIVTLPERVVFSTHTSDFAYRIIKPVDFSSEWDAPPTWGQLRARAQKYVKDNEGWVLNDNISVSFVNLADTLEYEDVANLEQVHLCDVIKIIYTKLGVEVEAKVVKTEWNVLKDRYNKIEIGNTRTNLYQTITEETSDVIIPQVTSHMQSALAYAQKLMQGGLGGYVVTTTNADGEPQEILIMNTPDINTATKVMRWNLGGIAFSDGYDAVPRTAWTIDGHFVADFIDTGTLTADIIRTGIIQDVSKKNYWNMDTGELSLNAGTKVGTSGDTVESMLTSINVNAEGITSEVTRATGVENGLRGDISGLTETTAELSSKIEQMPGEIKLSVSGKASKSTGASITLTVKDTNGNVISGQGGSGTILIDGNVVFTSQLTDNTTTISGGNIKTGTITLGGKNNGNPVVTLLDNNNAEIGHWDNTGLMAKQGTIGGWDINPTNLRKDSAAPTGSGTQYTVVLSANTGGASEGAIQVAQRTYTDGQAGSWTYPFRVNYDGSVTATKITIGDANANSRIGQWVIDNNSIYYGTKGNSNNASDITLQSSGTFNRTVNYANRTGLKFAIGGKFAVDQNGKLYCGDGDFSGVFNTQQFYGSPGRWRKVEIAQARISAYWGGTDSTRPSFSSAAAVIDFEEESDHRSGCGNIDFYNTTIETADGSVHSSSDKNLKTGIETLDSYKAISMIKALRPVKYYWKSEKELIHSHHGFIAQEVEEVIKDDWWVAVKSKTKGTYTLGYSEFIADLVAVNQNLLERVEKLEEALHG